MTTNHPAHGPVSLDRLHQISEILSKAAAQSDGGNLGYAMADAVKVIDGAIASFGAEPVAWLHSDNGIGIPAITRSRNVADSWFSKGWNIKPLYTTPPAPVVPEGLRMALSNAGIAAPESDEMLAATHEKYIQALVTWVKDRKPFQPAPVVPEVMADPDESQYGGTYDEDYQAECAYVEGWNACRAAMLQGAEPASNCDELPLDYLQGHKDGLEWAAQLAEANHPQTGDWLYDDPIELARAIRKGPDMPEFKSVSVDEDDNFYSWFGRFWYENYQKNNYTTSAKQMLCTMAEFAYRAGRESAAQAGNSPVTPDGYVLVPKELTCEMDDAAWDAYHETRCMSDIWAALLAAAPQREADNG